MKKIVFFASVLAVLGLTACERTLDVGEDNASTGQVKNSVLQVRTRGASGQGITDHRRRRADAEHRIDGGNLFGVCCGRCVVI